MSDKSFLKHFITEPVYVIPGENLHLAAESKQKVAGQEPPLVEQTATSEQTAEVVQQPVKVEEPVAEPVAKKEQKKTYHYKGINIKKVLIIVDQPDHEFIGPEDEAFLSKIMTAVKLDLNDLAILNIKQNSGSTFKELLNFDATKYLVFGPDQKFFEKDYVQYQLIAEESNQILHCSALSTIAADASQKKLLWLALQKMFL